MARRIIYIPNPKEGSHFRTVGTDHDNPVVNKPRTRRPRTTTPRNTPTNTQPNRGPSNTQPPPFINVPIITFPTTPPGIIPVTFRQGSPSDYGYTLVDFSFDEGVTITTPDWMFGMEGDFDGPQFADDPNWHPTGYGFLGQPIGEEGGLFNPNPPNNSMWTGYEGMEWATGNETPNNNGPMQEGDLLNQ